MVLTEIVDDRRLEANSRLDPKVKSEQGQFMTSRHIAQFMASLFKNQNDNEIRLLDAGAGVGSLTAAFVKEFCNRSNEIRHIIVKAYETDSILAQYLLNTFADCHRECCEVDITFAPQLIEDDFIVAGVSQLLKGVKPEYQFTHAILNPPYKKIRSESQHRQFLSSIGIETVNLYTGFLSIIIKMLAPGGQLVAIIPRSFCNGPYFKPFRQLLLDEMSLRHIHIFESRVDAFKDDEVLQENIILYAVKGQSQEQVTLSVSPGADFDCMSSRTVDFCQIVSPSDPDHFIHIVVNEDDQYFVDRMDTLPCTLSDLGIDVSTGPVVDFRLKEYLRNNPETGAVPLIYPSHCREYFVAWPLLNGKKPNAIMDVEPVSKWLYPNGHYVVVRRFSSKEEPRRVIAAILDPENIQAEKIGFENHLNVFHRNRQGLYPELSRGLAVYLNSTLYDMCFRQFSGHTQVNVTDLYNLRYPSLATLESLGRRVNDNTFLTQQCIDEWIEELF